jgi:hypothetical protein
MFMLVMATIYQGQNPVLLYTKEHMYLLSRAHLHHEINCEIVPRVKDIIDVLKSQNPQPNTASEHSDRATCLDHDIIRTNAETPT